MAGRITFLRHAESAANAGLKTASNAEGPLSDKGYAQAAAFAERMAKPPDLLLVSPFRRTLETAAPIRERFPGLPCEIRDGLHEFVYLSPARFNGTDASQRAPAIADYWAAMDPRRCDGPDAESFAEFMGRVRGELDYLGALRDAEILVVSHGQFIHLARELNEVPDIAPHDMMPRFHREWKAAQIGNAETFELTLRETALRG